jgi:thiamine biosynthesis lipoprotein
MPPDRVYRPTRRDIVTLGIGAFVVAFAPLAARRTRRVVRRTIPMMGTIADVMVVTSRPDQARLAIDAAMAELAAVERGMSRFHADSDLGRANAEAARQPVGVSPATAGVIARALQWATWSDGAFDPAIGRVVELWDVTHRHAPPPPTLTARLAGRRLHRAVEVGLEGGRPALFYTSDDVHLDLGGIAKGYGVDRAADALRAQRMNDALINVGGDLVALGCAADGNPWRVGVRSAEYLHSLTTSIDAVDCALATSGDYEQFFRHRGVKYHHLMDPVTAAPGRGPRHSVTVRADRCIDADAGATAVFGMPVDQAARVLAAAGSCALVDA